MSFKFSGVMGASEHFDKRKLFQSKNKNPKELIYICIFFFSLMYHSSIIMNFVTQLIFSFNRNVHSLNSRFPIIITELSLQLILGF